jgi:hypothetical protein
MKQVKNTEKLRKIYEMISIASTEVDNLAREESQVGTDFKVHKALNISFKELDELRMLYLSMLGEKRFSKTYLRKMVKDQSIGLTPLDSWNVYL